MKTLILLCLLVMISTEISKAQNKLPALDYIPQSPAAAAFSRYGEIPVNYSTGVPSIEIPIYAVKVGDLTIPITISYHASGIKVRDVANEVGLGFVLNTGGVVTASIVGQPDFIQNKPSFKQASDVANSISSARSQSGNSQAVYNLAWNYWNNYVRSGWHDYFSDRYYYSLSSGESGFFRKDFVNDSIRFMPFRPIRVEMALPAINITSSNGYKHYFQGDASTGYYLLNKIVSEKRTDSILYQYNGGLTYQMAIQYGMSWGNEKVEIDNQISCSLITRNNQPHSSSSRSGGSVSSPVPAIKSLVTKDEVISFFYKNDRQDENNMGFGRLVKIVIVNRHDPSQVIKKIDLNHSYFGTAASGNLRLKLNSITMSDSVNSPGYVSKVNEKYSFEYNALDLPPYPSLQHEIYYEDFWGYYNGVAKTTLFPSFPFVSDIPNGANFPYANMEPDGFFSKACILTGINYPTGGRTTFEYEPNNLEVMAGGLRVKRITSYTDGSSKAFVKTYAYDGAVAKTIEQNNFKYEEQRWVAYQGQVPNGQTNCTVVLNGYTENIGSSTSINPITINNGAPVVYTNVTEYTGDEVNNIGRTTYSYNYEDCEQRNIRPGDIDDRFFNTYHSDCGNYVPELSSTSTYKMSNGTYNLVRVVENEYIKYKQREFNTGINFSSKIIIGQENWDCDADQAFFAYNAAGMNGGDYLNTLVYTDTKGYEEVSLLSKSIVKDYGEGGILETETAFLYDTKYTQLKQKMVNLSDGRKIKTEYKYPENFKSSEPYYTMVARNILTPVIEQSDFKDSAPVQSLRTNYAEVFPNVIVPTSVETRNGTDPYETRVRYETYDTKGNVLSAYKEDDVKTSYIWGYNSTYPVAKIVGADYNSAYNILSGADKNILNSPGATDQQVRDIVSKIRGHATMVGKMVYTYTYKPAVGMTSSTDENGLVTFFEYDSFNRLQLVKDNAGNVVKANTYHYKKQ